MRHLFGLRMQAPFPSDGRARFPSILAVVTPLFRGFSSFDGDDFIGIRTDPDNPGDFGRSNWGSLGRGRNFKLPKTIVWASLFYLEGRPCPSLLRDVCTFIRSASQGRDFRWDAGSSVRPGKRLR